MEHETVFMCLGRLKLNYILNLNYVHTSLFFPARNRSYKKEILFNFSIKKKKNK